MFDFNKIGMRPGFSTDYEIPATESQLNEIEKYFGHSLPDNYRQLLQKFHGGKPQAKYFDVIDTETEIPLEYQLREFFLVDEKKDVPINVWWVLQQNQDFLDASTLPFASDGYNHIYYFKWANDEAQVWCLAFMEDEEPDSFFMFNSFDELLGALYDAE